MFGLLVGVLFVMGVVDIVCVVFGSGLVVVGDVLLMIGSGG